jgi:hypothetical protein
LRHDVARARLALAALGGDAQLQLNIVKPHASTRVADDVAVGDTFADTNNHGQSPDVSKQGWGKPEDMIRIINANLSHLQ